MNNFEFPFLKGKSNVKKVPTVLKIGICIFGFLLLILLFTLSYKKEYKINYNEGSTLDYKVFLKPNPYYSERYLGMNKEYITSLIDKITAELAYTFSTDDSIDIMYDYNLISSIEIDNVNGKNIFTKEEVIKEKTNQQLNNDNKLFSIKENVDIDYYKYNNLASQFIKEYDLSGVTANLVIKLGVNITGKHNDYAKNATNKSVVSMKIPLVSDTTSIEIKYDLSNESDVVLQLKETIVKNKTAMVILGIAALLDVVSIAIIIIIIVKTRDPHAKYEVALANILRDYGDYICETNITEQQGGMEQFKLLQIVSVKNFAGLLEAADKIQKPILYHEERVGEQAVFYTYDVTICYIYRMSINDFK